MEQKQKPIHAALQKTKSLFSRKAKSEGARRLGEKEQKELNERLFTAILEYTKSVWNPPAGIKRLLKAGADIDARNEYGTTPLMLAAMHGNAEICALLVEKGANIEAKDNEGKTALMHAAIGGYHKIVKYLVSRGADVNARDNEGKTALVRAASGGSTTKEWKTVRVLLRNGANQLGAAFAVAKFDVAELLKKAMMKQFENVIGKQSFALFMRSFKECTA